MRKVSIRIPEPLVRAYDDADGSRSAVMRRVLSEAVADGDVQGVPEDLRTLAERERAVEGGELARKAGTFKQRAHDYFGEKWRSGAVTADDAERLAESWRDEAALYGAEDLAYVEAVVDYWADEWAAVEARRGQWPTPAVFLAEADPRLVDGEITDRLADTLRDARRDGLERSTAVERVAKFHPRERVEMAADRAYGGGDV
jgi:hypothetical protein